MSTREKIIKSIELDIVKFFSDSNIDSPIIKLERVDDFQHGDLSTSAALKYGKTLKKDPYGLAQDVASYLSKKQLDCVERVEAVKPGFINIFFTKEFFQRELRKTLQDKNFGKNNFFKNRKIIVEHTQPNPFKEFHIGHFMNNVIGESIARILKVSGCKVKTASYHGDVGLHVAKAIWGSEHQGELRIMDIQSSARAYAVGSQMYDADPQIRKEINKINSNIYNRSDQKINVLYDSGKKTSLDYFDSIYKKLGSHFDRHFYESEVSDIGKNIVLKNTGKIFEKGDNGAIIFKGENFIPKTHTRVFLNAEGLPTYEAKELGLAKAKRDWWNYGESITITANEQDSFFDVTEVAIGKVFPELKGKLQHLSHGMLRLPSGKMSSRTGKVVTAELLIEKVKEIVRQKAVDKNIDDTTIEIIAIGALKYSILKQSIGSDIIYDFEKSISFDGDSGPYLQYSYARAQSVLRKAKSEKIKPSLKKIPNEINHFVKQMHYFPEIVEKAGKEYEPHFIVLYLTELAREFNNYYAKNKIVDKADEFSPYKVALTEAFSIIMKNGLWLLGINSVEKM